MSAKNAPQAESLQFSGIINCFETATHAGTITQEERQPKRWDRDQNVWKDAVPAHWHVTLSPIVSNRAWRQVNIPLTRCRDLESAAKLAMRLLPADQIAMRGAIYGGVFEVKRNALVEIW